MCASSHLSDLGLAPDLLEFLKAMPKAESKPLYAACGG